MKADVTAIVPIQKSTEIPLNCLKSIFTQNCRPAEVVIIFNSLSPADQKFASKLIKSKAPRSIHLKFLNEKLPSSKNIFFQSIAGLKIASKKYLWIIDSKNNFDKDLLRCAMDGIKSEDKNFYSTKNATKNKFVIGNYIKNPSGVIFQNSKCIENIFTGSANYGPYTYDWLTYYKLISFGEQFYDASAFVLPTEKQNSINNEAYIEIQKMQNQLAINGESNIQLKKQYLRKIGFTENPKNTGCLGNIAWLIPDFGVGSGGHRTIFTNAEALITRGYRCDIYVNNNGSEPPIEIMSRIKKSYGIDFSGDIYNSHKPVRDYDAVFATSWDTAFPAKNFPAKNKLYFIQDYEPWFYPIGDTYFSAIETYNYGFRCITIGKWLANKISEEHSAKTEFFNFCADLNAYHPIKDIKSEKAICAVFQPEKPRRCHKLVLEALKVFQTRHPEIKIYLYGSPKTKIDDLATTHLGTISVQDCNKLYNKCLVGLCISASNPSRIPFEMMAAGLPVVDLDRENNKYDLYDGGCLLAKPNAEAIANTLSDIVEDQKLQDEMSKKGQMFMRDYPLEKGYNKFVQFVDKILKN